MGHIVARTRAKAREEQEIVLDLRRVQNVPEKQARKCRRFPS